MRLRGIKDTLLLSGIDVHRHIQEFYSLDMPEKSRDLIRLLHEYEVKDRELFLKYFRLEVERKESQLDAIEAIHNVLASVKLPKAKKKVVKK